MNSQGPKSALCSVLEGGWAKALAALPGEGLGRERGELLFPAAWAGAGPVSSPFYYSSLLGSGCPPILPSGQETVSWVSSWVPFFEPAPLTRKALKVKYLEKSATRKSPEQASATSLCTQITRRLRTNADSGSAGQRRGLRTYLLQAPICSSISTLGNPGGEESVVKDDGAVLISQATCSDSRTQDGVGYPGRATVHSGVSKPQGYIRQPAPWRHGPWGPSCLSRDRDCLPERKCHSCSAILRSPG